MTNQIRSNRPQPWSARQIQDDVQLRSDAVKRHREAKRLGTCLTRMLHIAPGGIEWVCVLADVSCKSNVEAVTQWVLLQLADQELGSDPSQAVLDVLQRRLLRQLENLEASN